jgi:hypothetical protein
VKGGRRMWTEVAASNDSGLKKEGDEEQKV